MFSLLRVVAHTCHDGRSGSWPAARHCDLLRASFWLQLGLKLIPQLRILS
jgi:hypothetical protein